jgi:hypothetical protein
VSTVDINTIGIPTLKESNVAKEIGQCLSALKLPVASSFGLFAESSGMS